MEHMVKGLRVNLFKRLAVDPSEPYYITRTAPDGELVGDVIVSIDMVAIIQVLGRKALKSKTKTCRDGFVVVRARNVRRVP